MDISEQVVSLELAKRMKELGFPQRTLFDWVQQGKWWKCRMSRRDGNTVVLGDEPEAFSAYTVAELDNLLPPIVENENGAGLLKLYKQKDGWRCLYRYYQYEDLELPVDVTEMFDNRSGADARAKLLIHLAEQKLIDPKELL